MKVQKNIKEQSSCESSRSEQTHGGWLSPTVLCSQSDLTEERAFKHVSNEPLLFLHTLND